MYRRATVLFFCVCVCVSTNDAGHMGIDVVNQGELIRVGLMNSFPSLTRLLQFPKCWVTANTERKHFTAKR